MNTIVWIVFGLMVGLIVNYFYPDPQKGGSLSAAILGILGAFVGGFLSYIVFGIHPGGYDLGFSSLALIGSLVLLITTRMLREIDKKRGVYKIKK